MKQAYFFAYVNHARTSSCNQPVLNNVGKSLLKETTGVFDGAQTHDWQVSTDYESNKRQWALF